MPPRDRFFGDEDGVFILQSQILIQSSSAPQKPEERNERLRQLTIRMK